MKKLKAILALLLVCCLCLALFAACANGESGTTDANDNSTGNTPGNNTSSDKDDAQGGTEQEQQPDEGEEEMVTVKMILSDARSTATDYGAPVAEAIAARLAEKYNINAEIQYMDYATYQQNLTLMIAGGEWLDIIPAIVWCNVGVIQPQGMLMDITDLLPEYAPDALALVEEYMDAYTFGGRLYGLPTLRNYCKNYYIVMRKDILQELNLLDAAESLSNWTDFESILATVTDAYAGTGLYAIGGYGAVGSMVGGVVGGDNFSDYITWDYLSDPVKVVKTDNDGNVSLYQAEPGFEEECARNARWLENGWLYPDTVFNESQNSEMMKNGIYFSFIEGSEYGIENTKKAATGYELVCPMLYPGIVTTNSLQNFGIAVPSTSEEPEAACRVINALYTDEVLMNLYVWGIEGKDYTVVNGEVVSAEGSHYLEGDYLMGNNLLLTPVQGNGADFYDRVAEINATATKSPYLGFVMDTSDMDLQVANISAVMDQYDADLSCGNYTPEKYQEYLSKLEVAGVYAYLDEIQAQLDAWLANQ